MRPWGVTSWSWAFSAAGERAVGQVVAGRLGHSFLDADALHGAEAVAKVARGKPLTDEERAP